MKLFSLLAGIAGASAGLLAYGAFTSDRLVAERRTLHLSSWPKNKSGLRIGLIADLHVRRDGESVRVCQTACDWLLGENPDLIVIAGDLIAYWQPGVLDLLGQALSPLAGYRGQTLVIPGNHEYAGPGDPDDMAPWLDERGLILLRNEARTVQGISFIGIDSGNSGNALPFATIAQADLTLPTVVLWHEPDFVRYLPEGLDLMLSGHSHGGQFLTPWGWAPMKSLGGGDYLSGFFPKAPCPLYVSRGLATTGPPSRFCCPPEVALLTLQASESDHGWMEQVSSDRLI